MYALVKHPLVDCDLEAAALWYHHHDPKVANRLIDETRNAMRAAATSPLRFAVRFEDIRRVRLRKFPHSVYFQVQGETVYVLALVHGAQEVKKLLHDRQPVV